ncbi:site-2 protease family protein [Candidatus Kaiserbacteria bacterium]|nr:site-2 protease family protein [Candidatus Kaiserbacteria bacterium]
MTILIFLAVLVVLILVHEFGHFIVAKRSGIRVDEFGIGFPPKLYGKKFGETEYTINALPFGGFVRIFGESIKEDSDEDLSGPDSARALIHKPKYIQAAVLFAGVFFNMIFAWILFSIVLAIGTPALGGGDGGRLSQYISNEQILITQVLEESPAADAGLIEGDEVISLSTHHDTITPQTSEEIGAFITTQEGHQIFLNYKRDGVEDAVIVVPQTGLLSESPESPAIGIGTGVVGTLTLPVHLAIFEGGKQTLEMLYRVTIGIGTFFYDALLFKADLSTVAGPVGIVSLVGSASALGFIALMNFTALISLNLAVINLIPFPALDGGRLLFLLVETIKGSPIRPKIANAFNMVGFAFLLLLMLVVTYGDIVRLMK